MMLMIEKFFSLLERLVLAVEKLAGEAPVPKVTPGAPPAADKPRRGRPPAKAAPASEPEGNGLDDDAPAVDDDADLGGGDDDGLGDEPESEPEVKVTKEMMREAMLKYQGLTDGNAARELLKASTSTKSVAFNTVKEAEYASVYNATLKATAALKGKKK